MNLKKLFINYLEKFKKELLQFLNILSEILIKKNASFIKFQ